MNKSDLIDAMAADAGITKAADIKCKTLGGWNELERRRQRFCIGRIFIIIKGVVD